MEAIMFRLLCQCSEADTVEMLRELRELKEMSQQERNSSQNDPSNNAFWDLLACFPNRAKTELSCLNSLTLGIYERIFENPHIN